jgi:uncharacterized protein
MDKVLIFLAVLAGLLILAQWHAIVSIRKYLFKRYDSPSRKWAYSALVLLGILNYAMIRLSFDSDLLPDIISPQAVSAAFFTYLGAALLLTIFFLILRSVNGIIGLTIWLKETICGKQPAGFGWICPIKMPKVRPEGNVDTDFSLQTEHETAERSQEASPISRRSFLRLASATGVLATSGLAAKGLAEAYGNPVIDRFDLANKKLSGLSKPLTFIQVTDFHLGMFLGTGELGELVELLNQIEGDALFITGDVFHSPLTSVESAEPVLKRLRPRTFGNFAVLGNHDFYAGVWRAVECLQRSGLTVLRDEWRTFSADDARIHLGGIDDPMVNWMWGTAFPKFDDFMKKAPKEPGMRILLSHRPSVLPFAAGNNIDFVLSGHIHGGQIILPNGGKGVSIASIVSQYTHGWYKQGGASMYLSRGVGLTFLPWRLNCPPEIAVFQVFPEDA